ncbi:MAG: transcriptional repressor CopY family [Actinomycetia bacterium]|nr:transcriptional repressor CopY family [Actinomycetes bacterium]
MSTRSHERRQRGELEAELLAVVAAAGTSLTPREVMNRLDVTLAYTTVMTVLSRLHDKGLLKRIREGRSYAYSFQRDEASLRAVQMRRLLESGHDRRQVLAHFITELSAEDEELLQRLLRDTTPDT